MSRKTATPDEIAQALAMREAGYTVLSISQHLGISVRSLQRHFAEHGSRKGAIKEELLQEARAELLKRVTSDDAILEEAARLINDDLAHTHHLRRIILEAAEQLKATDLKEAALVMRAAAAYSTAVKNTSDMLRHTLKLERALKDGATEPPELIVRELSAEDIETIKGKTQADKEALID